MAVPVNINARGVPVTVVGGQGVVTLGPDGKIPSNELHYGSPGDPAGPLGPDGRIPSSQMPVDALEYKGSWNAATNTPTLVNGTGTTGDTYAISTTGTQNLGGGSVEYLAGNFLIYSGTVWDQIGSGNMPVAANPSVTVGLTAKNGTAETYMRSDGAPALDQSIVPTWTGAHTFTQPMTTAAITSSGLISSSAGLAGNTTVTAGIGSNSVQMTGAPNGTDPKIQALGVTDANVSIELKAKGTGLLKMASPTTVAGNLTVAGEVSAAQGAGSASPTNSGIALATAPNWSMAQFYDAARPANNRSMDILFISDGLHMRFVNDARNAFLDFLAVTGGQALGVTGITSTSGSGSWTHTGTHTVVQPNDVYKMWVAKSTASDTQNAPTAIGAASTYLQIGGREWKVNGFGGIGFGYVTGTNVNPPVWVGWEEKVTSSFTNGDFIIATRSTNTNVAPTERLRITAAGDLQAWAGYVPGTPQSLATMGDVAARVAADGKTAQAANINAPALYAVPTSGLYRVSSYIVISQAATTSSTMPSVTVEYTDATIGAALSELMTNTSTANTVGTHLGGSAVISAQQGTNIGYVTAGYASSGATAMQYAVHMKIEFLG